MSKQIWRKSLWVLILVLSWHIGQSQENNLITGSYIDQHFAEVVHDIESRYPFKIFFDQSLDSSLITLEVKDATLSELANELNRSTDLNFLIKNNKVIICTGQYNVQAQLSDVFFSEADKINNPGDSTIKPKIRSILSEQDSSDVISLVTIGDPAKRFKSKKANVTGIVRFDNSGEPIVGASVYIKEPELFGVSTDEEGRFSIDLAKGESRLFFNSTGAKETFKDLMVYSDGEIDVDLTPDIIALDEVIVTDDRDLVESVRPGATRLKVEDLKQIPSLLGEADILQIALTLPGVQTTSEGAAGFNVRGSSADQNLILLDGVPLYNTNHLFGFFSVFNPDVISEATLYKSGISAHYGGRLSSVFDVSLRDGNKQEFHIQGGISPVTAKVELEGPIKKEKSSYLLGLRGTYSDWIFTLLDDTELKNSSARFNDIVAKVTTQPNNKNKLTFSAYNSYDNFRLSQDTLYEYGNTTASMNWNHVFSKTSSAQLSLSYAGYNYAIEETGNASMASRFSYKIDHFGLNLDFSKLLAQKSTFKYGLSTILYKLEPGRIEAIGESIVQLRDIEQERGLESAIYGTYEADLSSRISASMGLRLSSFLRLGEATQYEYESDQPLNEFSLNDTTSFGPNETVESYIGPEIRIAGRYKINESLSFKMAYDRLYQYIHVLSNTVSISPVDSWRLSSKYIEPQIANQFSAGMYKLFDESGIEVSLEGYYKILENGIDYKDGADLRLNEIIETEITSVDGRSYGVEFFLRKKVGDLVGWLSYTYSRSLLQTNSPFAEEQINGNEEYRSNFDRPHSFSLTTSYQINKRLGCALNLYYISGKPTTVPIAQYELEGIDVLQYSDRNSFRIPDYFRLDLAVNLEGNHRLDKKIHGSWSFAIYNLTSRHNASSIFFRTVDNDVDAYRFSVFKYAVPTITYHFELK